MRVLVTRPANPAERTAAKLRAMGHEPLVDPVLSLDFFPPASLVSGQPDGIIFTSSNAVRAVREHPHLPELLSLPIWTVGSRTTASAREMGFGIPRIECPDVASLIEVLKDEKTPLKLLHIAGEDRSADIASGVASSGHSVETVVVYRATPSERLSDETREALGNGSIDAVLHYSARSAGTFLTLAEKAGLQTEAEAPIHVCLSPEVAERLRAVNAAFIRIADGPNEDALLAALGQEEGSSRQDDGATVEENGLDEVRTGMAEADEPENIPEKPKRSGKPKPQVLDLEATEIDRPQPEPVAEEPAEAPQDAADDRGSAAQAGAVPNEPLPPLDDLDPDVEPRSGLLTLVAAGLIGAVLAILGFVILLSANLLGLNDGDDPAIGSRLTAIESKIQSIDQAPAATPPSPVMDPALTAKVDELSKAVTDLANRPVPASEGSAPAQIDTSRLDALDGRIAAIDTKLGELGEAPAGPSQDAFNQLSARVDQIAAALAQSKEPDPAIAEARALAKRAADLAMVASLEAAVERGIPYASLLGVVRTQVQGVDVTPLEAGAEHGLPAIPVLGARLEKALDAAPSPTPAASAGVIDRLVSGARGLVTVKPVGDTKADEPVGDDAWTIRNRTSLRLQRGAYDEALSEWEQLDARTKQATQQEADALRARLAAERTLDTLREKALAAAGGETQ